MSVNEPVTIIIDYEEISNNITEKSLGVKFNRELSFETHKKGLCKNASNKTHALARIALYMSLLKRKSIMHEFVNAQFNYCLLVCVFHIRK